MSAVRHLRAATADDHAMVDSAFAAFDFADRDGYARFLTAHAMALPAVEAVLSTASCLPPWRSREPRLRDDLDALSIAMPARLPLAEPGSDAAMFGTAYVIEGSRLGGGMLAKSVPDAFPKSYLSDVHRSGEWRSFLAALDDAAEGPDWIDEAISAARETFALYSTAAALVRTEGPRSAT